MCKPPDSLSDDLLYYIKVLKGLQVDMSFGLAWLGWATNTEEIIFNRLTELQEILHSEWLKLKES